MCNTVISLFAAYKSSARTPNLVLIAFSYPLPLRETSHWGFPANLKIKIPTKFLYGNIWETLEEKDFERAEVFERWLWCTDGCEIMLDLYHHEPTSPFGFPGVMLESSADVEKLHKQALLQYVFGPVHLLHKKPLC